jgi:alanine racemase
LEINDEAKELVQEIGEAINAAVERSPQVADAISRLRAAGYEMELTLKLEIGLRETGTEDDTDEEAAQTAAQDDAATLELTDEDRRTLRSMKIRFDESE